MLNNISGSSFSEVPFFAGGFFMMTVHWEGNQRLEVLIFFVSNGRIEWVMAEREGV